MDGEVTIRFDAHAMTGGIRLKATLCERPEDMSQLQAECNFTKEQMLEKDPDEKLLRDVGSETDSPDPNMCSANRLQFGKGTLRAGNQAPCVYLIGVIGLANYTSHYSVMVEVEDATGMKHPTVLSEGIPQVRLVKPKRPDYFMLSIDDPDISKLTIQLTAIHGDPDVFVSTTTKTPSQYNHERRSTNAGLYPDLVIFERTPNYNLTKTFYIQVQAWQESSYTLTYFTSNDKGQIGTQKLMVGQKQNGVLHLNT